MRYDRDAEQAVARNLLRLRKQSGITQAQAAKLTRVAINTWSGWEQGRRTPKFWRIPQIAKALQIPIAALFDEATDDRCIAEVRVSVETLRVISRDGRSGAEEAADRLARALTPLLYEAARGRKMRPNTGGRAKPRRTREEVLANMQSANTARLRTAELLKQARGDHPAIELEP